MGSQAASVTCLQRSRQRSNSCTPCLNCPCEKYTRLRCSEARTHQMTCPVASASLCAASRQRSASSIYPCRCSTHPYVVRISADCEGPRISPARPQSGTAGDIAQENGGKCAG